MNRELPDATLVVCTACKHCNLMHFIFFKVAKYEVNAQRENGSVRDLPAVVLHLYSFEYPKIRKSKSKSRIRRRRSINTRVVCVSSNRTHEGEPMLTARVISVHMYSSHMSQSTEIQSATLSFIPKKQRGYPLELHTRAERGDRRITSQTN